MVLRLAAAAILLSALPSAAHDAHDPRHMAMEHLGETMKALDRAAKGAEALDSASVERAESILSSARRLPSLFAESSRGKKGSRETPQIWSDWAGFERAAEAFEAEAAKLAAAARLGDKAASRASLKAVGAACTHCHDRFRAPKR